MTFASTKLPLRKLEYLGTMLAWRDQDVRIRIAGDVPDIALKMPLSGKGRNTP